MKILQNAVLWLLSYLLKARHDIRELVLKLMRMLPSGTVYGKN